MPLLDALRLPFAIPVIEMISALVISCFTLSALLSLVRGHGIPRARLLVEDGAILGLSVKLAATLLKTLELHAWRQIALFAAILFIRTLLKRAFAWERRLSSRRALAVPG